jgi:SAM-dependent methyltransferase
MLLTFDNRLLSRARGRVGRLTTLLRAQWAARADGMESQHKIFSRLDDYNWWWCNTTGYREYEVLRKILPSLPDEATQIAFIGRAGDCALAEAFGAYLLWREMLTKYRDALSPDSRVLDFGCGWGRTLRFFMRDVQRDNLHGVDCMPAAIELCRKTNPWNRFTLINPLPPADLPSSHFDLVYLFSVFSHLSEAAHDQWLTEFRRVLRPGGLLIATTWPRVYIERCERARQGDTRGTHPGSLGAFIGTAGWLARYDRGEYCHSAVGGGTALSSAFYGETCIPEAFVHRRWQDRFLFREYISDVNRCHQNVIVVQNPG